MPQLFCIAIATLISCCIQATQFVIVTPSYNNERYCLRNIQSVVDQNYQDWVMVIVNDCSTDRTSELLHNYIQQHNLQNKVILIDNQERKGALRNLYEIIHQCPDNHVVFVLDGDDHLATPTALERVARAYADGSTWLTYGQFIYYPYGILGFCKPFPPEIMQQKRFRTYNWLSSHPRTFYAWLFKKIAIEDLLYEGKFLPMACDVATMLPMLEMASNGHITCIEEVLYVYNDENPLNDHKKDVMFQQHLGFSAAGRAVYPTL
jgi:glycosyltransferase involved in cell wall biosynthesis